MNESPTSREVSAGVPASRNGPLSLSERVQSLRLPDRPEAPRSWRTYLPWALVALLAATTAFLALREGAPEAEAASSGSGPGAGGNAVLPSTGNQADAPAGAVVLKNKGNITPIRKIQVSPKVSGMVVELIFKEGDKVVKDKTVLAKLETVEYDADYREAKAQERSARRRLTELTDYRPEEIAQSKAELDEAKAQMAQLYSDWKRSVTLRGQALSAKDYEQAESAYRQQERKVERLRLAHQLMCKGPRDERIDAALNDHEAAEARTRKAKWRLDNCVVYAPLDGTILTKRAEEGNIVNPAAFNIAASLCDIANLAEMEVDLSIPERDISKVFRGQWDAKKKVWRRQKCRILPEAYPERPYHGYVSRIMPLANRNDAAVPVRVKIHIPQDEAGVYLRPDMGALVSFLNEWEETTE